MRNVTIYRDNHWDPWIKIWENRDSPTKEELTPTWAEILYYTKFPHDVIDVLQNSTRDAVHSFLNDYLP